MSAPDLAATLAAHPRPLRVLVTGSRWWTDRETIRKALAGLPPGSTVVHGACGVDVVHPDMRKMRGADLIADQEARALGFAVDPHPAAWSALRRGAGPRRNQEMVDLGADVCFAFPGPDSTGTYDCMRRAREAGIRVVVHGARP